MTLFDYTTITADSIRASVDRALAEADEVVAGIVDLDAPESFGSVLAPLDAIGDLLARTYGITAFMGYVHPDPEVRATGKEVEERISKWGVELTFREDLYRVVKAYADTPDAADLGGERKRLLEFTMREFRQAGHELDADTRAAVKDMTNRLVELGVAFERNIAEDDAALVVTAEDLVGLPQGYLESLDPGPDDGTYLVTMAYPHVVPFLDNAARRDLRERLSFLFNSRAVGPNRPILEEAVDLRHQIAQRFGLVSWAHKMLEDRMAKTPEAVEEFYAELLPPLQEAATEDIRRMAEMLDVDTGDGVLQPWDWRFYDTKLRREQYGVDQAAIAQYFPLQHVLDGMFEITGEVFGLTYRRIDAPTWHPDVITYAIADRDTGDPISHFYMDLFPREGKFSHAAAFPLTPGCRREDGSYQSPVSAIVANLTKPSGDRPSLLLHSEVETLFHEFGHILHQTLTRAELVRFSGTSTERDFVEAPSQIMQHWTWKPDVLSRFARHHQTGEPIPSQLVEQLTAAKLLNVAVAKLRQITYGSFDMGIHGPGEHKDLDAILRRASDLSLLPFQTGTFFPASFGHMFGYDAGYYGYLWSEVFGDDMFSRFEEEGYLSPEVGRSYRREILETGGTRDGIDHLRAFLGREPDNAAFLGNLGITS